MVSNDLLRRDVRVLGDMLGDVITELAGAETLALVERVRHLARERRGGAVEAERQLAECIAGFTEEQARLVSRAFSIFFDLANLAEDRHRVRVLRFREAERHPTPVSESIPAAIAKLHEEGRSATEVQAALDRLAIELVFTAHPSEAKRRSIRAKLRRMRQALQESDREDLLPRERQRLQSRLKTELAVLWQTEFLRPNKPTVLEEVERGLSINPRLWEVVPQIYEAMRKALETHYPGREFDLPVFLRFGSWMGGDRDGNPHVTAEITAQTLVWLREAAIKEHLAHCQQMYDFLSMAVRQADPEHPLERYLAERCAAWPALAAEQATLGPKELYRRWVRMIQWRLKQSQAAMLFQPLPAGAYRSGQELADDVEKMCTRLGKHQAQLVLESELQKWIDLVRVFGLHLTRLDVRQDARRNREVLAEVLAAIKACPNFAEITEADRQAVLLNNMGWKGEIPREGLSPLAQDTLQLYQLLHATLVTFGDNAIGGSVISLTREPSDVLAVLWLWRWAQANPVPAVAALLADGTLQPELRIIPLFEKIGDLQQAPATLAAILDQPVYRDHLRKQGNRQIVMVGYSDSTKDGGYFAACWGLYQAQSDLHDAADERGVQLTFFHGRGGSLGRGGGPAARGILSLPPQALDGTLRLTEQGEVLAERYDDVQIAYRHLEQVTWATLLASSAPGAKAGENWTALMERLSKRSYQAYRELVDQPGFIEFFAEATPIEEIENLPIGSRPARRRGERTLADLRRIPWVFSWTQNRCLIPAWYGLGTALLEVKYADRLAWQSLCEMYRTWPFLQATIDNATLALAKADMYIAQRYAELAEDAEVRQRLWTLIASERDRTRQALLDIVGGSELLAATPWFQGSIEVRNPYIDPLNLIQIELLKRRRASDPANEDENRRLRELLRLTVQGIAAGMRTTG